jgi:hypothetical protein
MGSVRGYVGYEDLPCDDIVEYCGELYRFYIERTGELKDFTFQDFYNMLVRELR